MKKTRRILDPDALDRPNRGEEEGKRKERKKKGRRPQSVKDDQVSKSFRIPRKSVSFFIHTLRTGMSSPSRAVMDHISGRHTPTLIGKKCLPSDTQAALSNNTGAVPCVVSRAWQSRGRWRTGPSSERHIEFESADINGSVFFWMNP